MAGWRVEVSGLSLNPDWITETSRRFTNKSLSPSTQFEVDDTELTKFFDYLRSLGYTGFSIYVVEKRIVLPASKPTQSCPTCGGTGQIRR